MTDRRRGLHAYKQHRDRQRALRLPCWLCHRPIDYGALPRSRWSFTLDHVIPISLGGSLCDPANSRSAHYSCNSARGARTPRQRQPVVAVARAQSRQW